MTITEAAGKYKVSTQAIYQRIKKAGKTVDDIRDKATGQLSAAGCSWLDEVYSSESINRQPIDEKLIDELKAEIETLKIECDQRIKAAEDKAAAEHQASEVLSVKLAAALEKVDMLTADKTRLENQVDSLLQTVSNMTQAKLPAPEGETDTQKKPKARRGLFGLFGKK